MIEVANVVLPGTTGQTTSSTIAFCHIKRNEHGSGAARGFLIITINIVIKTNAYVRHRTVITIGIGS
jgi:hypothetical protein